MAYVPATPSISRTQLEQGARVWLLTVEMGASLIRWSSRPVVIPRAAGGEVQFDGGLDARTQELMLDMFAGAGEDAEASFSELPAPPNLGAFVARGAVLGGARGEASLWTVGTTWEQRQVFVDGVLSRPEYGGARDPVAFTITTQASTSTALWPLDVMVLGTSSFGTTARESDLGAPYPQLLGRLSPTRTLNNQSVPCSRALVIGADVDDRAEILLVAGHRLASNSVGIIPTDGTTRLAGEAAAEFQVITGLDDYGETVSTVDVSTRDPAWREASQFMVVLMDADGGWSAADQWRTEAIVLVASVGGNDYDVTVGSTDGFSEGLCQLVDGDGTVTTATLLTVIDPTSLLVNSNRVAPDPLGYIRQLRNERTELSGAGDVLIWCLERTDLIWNRAQWEGLRKWLNGWEIGCAIEESIDLWDFARTQILPLVPVSIANGPRGIEPIPWRYDATAADAIAKIRRGPEVVRTSPVRFQGDPKDIVNAWRIEYAVSALTNNPRGYLAIDPGLGRLIPTRSIETVTAGAILVPVPFTRTTAAARSATVYGIREDQLQSDVIWSRTAAHMACSWWPVRFGLQHREVDYTIPAEFGYLRPGDVVVLTDDELGEEDRVALVAEMVVGDSPWMDITLQLVTNPDVSKPTTGPDPAGADSPLGGN